MPKVTAVEARRHVQEGGLFRLQAEPGISLMGGGEIRGIRIQVGTENPATGKVRWKDGPYLMGVKGEPESYLTAVKAAMSVLDGSASLPGDEEAA